MNALQKRIVLASFILTLSVVLLDNIFPGITAIRFFKLLVIIGLFLRALTIPKKYPEQRLFTVSLFFTAAGDFIFVVAHTRPMLFSLASPLGAAFFALAYLLLLYVFTANVRITFAQLMVLLLFMGLCIPVFLKYFGTAQAPLVYALFLFGLILCCMTWRAVCTLFSGYYTTHAAAYMALAGFLIFLSDALVGMAVYEPSFSGLFVPWLENMIWGTFILAWTVIVVLIAEDKLVEGID